MLLAGGVILRHFVGRRRLRPSQGEEVGAGSRKGAVAVGQVCDRSHLGDERIVGRARRIDQRPTWTFDTPDGDVLEPGFDKLAVQFFDRVEVEDSCTEASVVVTVRHEPRSRLTLALSDLIIANASGLLRRPRRK